MGRTLASRNGLEVKTPSTEIFKRICDSSIRLASLLLMTGLAKLRIQMIRLRDEVRLLRRDCGGAYLIDLAGDAFALDCNDTENLTKAISSSREEIEQIGLFRELKSLNLIWDELSWTHWFRQRSRVLTRIPLRALLLGIQSRGNLEQLASRFLSRAYLAANLFNWPMVAKAWVGIDWDAGQIPIDASISSLSDAVTNAAARHFFPVRCKEKSLASYALCRILGHEPVIHVGGSTTFFELHCWTSVGDRVIADDRIHCEQKTVLATWK